MGAFSLWDKLDNEYTLLQSNGNIRYCGYFHGTIMYFGRETKFFEKQGFKTILGFKANYLSTSALDGCCHIMLLQTHPNSTQRTSHHP